MMLTVVLTVMMTGTRVARPEATTVVQSAAEVTQNVVVLLLFVPKLLLLLATCRALAMTIFVVFAIVSECGLGFLFNQA